MNGNNIHAALIEDINAIAQIENIKTIMPKNDNFDTVTPFESIIDLGTCDIKIKVRLGADSLTVTYNKSGEIKNIKIRCDCSLEKLNKINDILAIKLATI